MDDLAFNLPYQGGEAAAGMVVRGLADSDAVVRLRAARAARSAAEYFRLFEGLATPVWDWANDRALYEALLAALSDADEAVAAEAASSIGRLYEPAAEIETSLTAAYWTAGDADFRSALIASLGEHGYTGDAVWAVLSSARGDTADIVRFEAVLATELCAVPDTRSVLTSWLATEENPDVIVAIEGALATLE
jgi:hypothetical protein